VATDSPKSNERWQTGWRETCRESRFGIGNTPARAGVLRVTEPFSNQLRGQRRAAGGIPRPELSTSKDESAV
jgi:hypothetical protein